MALNRKHKHVDVRDGSKLSLSEHWGGVVGNSDSEWKYKGYVHIGFLWQLFLVTVHNGNCVLSWLTRKRFVSTAKSRDLINMSPNSHWRLWDCLRMKSVENSVQNNMKLFGNFVIFLVRLKVGWVDRCRKQLFCSYGHCRQCMTCMHPQHSFEMTALKVSKNQLLCKNIGNLSLRIVITHISWQLVNLSRILTFCLFS